MIYHHYSNRDKDFKIEEFETAKIFLFKINSADLFAEK